MGLKGTEKIGVVQLLSILYFNYFKIFLQLGIISYKLSIKLYKNMPISNEIPNLFNATDITHISADKLRTLVVSPLKC